MLERLVNEVYEWIVAAVGCAVIFVTLYGMCQAYELLTNVFMF